MGDREPIQLPIQDQNPRVFRSTRRASRTRLAALTLLTLAACGPTASTDSGRDIKTAFSPVTAPSIATIDTQLPGTTTTIVAGVQIPEEPRLSAQDAVESAKDQVDQDKAKAKTQRTTIPQAPTTVFDGSATGSVPAGVLPEEASAPQESQPDPEPEPAPAVAPDESLKVTVPSEFTLEGGCGPVGKPVCIPNIEGLLREDTSGYPAGRYCNPPARPVAMTCVSAPTIPQSASQPVGVGPQPALTPTTRPLDGGDMHF